MQPFFGQFCTFQVNWVKNMQTFYQLWKKYALPPLFSSPFIHFFSPTCYLAIFCHILHSIRLGRWVESNNHCRIKFKLLFLERTESKNRCWIGIKLNMKYENQSVCFCTIITICTVYLSTSWGRKPIVVQHPLQGQGYIPLAPMCTIILCICTISTICTMVLCVLCTYLHLVEGNPAVQHPNKARAISL